MNSRFLRLTLASVGAILLVPAAADATTRWAKPGGATSGDCSTIATACRADIAVQTAQSGDEAVFLAGTYDVTAHPIQLNKNVDVHALGTDKPVITSATGGSTPTFYVYGPAAGATVRDLAIRNTASNGKAVVVEAKATLKNLAIQAGSQCVAISAPGVTADTVSAIQIAQAASICFYANQDHTTLKKVSIIEQASGGNGLWTGGSGTTLDDVYVSAAGGAALISPAAAGTPVTIHRSRFNGSYFGLSVTGGPVLVTDTFARSTATNGTAVAVSYGARVTLRNVTAIGRGTDSYGVDVQASESPDTTVKIRNSIVRGTKLAVAVDPGGPNPSCAGSPPPCLYDDYQAGTASIAYSNVNSFSATVGAGPGLQSGDPLFLDPAGDYRLGDGSPAIDAGADDPENGTTDYYGSPRKQGNAVDLGAYEATPGQAPAQMPPDDVVPNDPSDPGTGGGGSGGTGGGGGGGGIAADKLAPVLKNVAFTRRRFTAKRGTALIYTLSEPGRLSITFQRQVVKKHKRKYVAAGSLSRLTPGGANTIAVKKKLKLGKYRVSVVAIDPAGNRSKPKALTFTVVRR